MCHTLVGATLARAGLDRLTRRAAATLMLAANLPDVDVIAMFFDRNLAWRRGVTHGLPALVVWPFVLSAVIWAWDRWRRRPGEPPVSVSGLLLISAIGVVTHPFLDYLNNYGMRWLMPVVDRWYYGDSLFIVDPWLYLVLGAGLWLGRRARRRESPDPARPVRIALALATGYIGLMVGSTMVARRVVAAELGGQGPAPRFMATAVPINPFVKQLVVDDGDRYRRGRVRLIGIPRVVIEEVVPKGQLETAGGAVAATEPGRAFLHWARFPVAVPLPGSDRVRIFDLRYSNGEEGWASVDAPVSGAGGSP